LTFNGGRRERDKDAKGIKEGKKGVQDEGLKEMIVTGLFISF
jgi:hypothetical protein